MLSDPAVAEFYVQLARRQADLGQLRLTFLRVAGERVAFNYLLQKAQKLYAVKIGYDPRYHSYSPGNMLLNLILKDACSRGIDEYDLLGGNDDWKFEWTKETREHRWLFVSRNRWRLRALHHLKFSAVPVVKKYTGRS
jgi:CelD/BcsL family acetyltransferase involved in cellulose biosynthesis